MIDGPPVSRHPDMTHDSSSHPHRQAFQSGLAKTLYIVDKSLHAAVEGAAEAVTLLAGSTLAGPRDEEPREIKAAYKEAKDELKHEHDWHKGDMTLDKVQRQYHTSDDQEAKEPEEQSSTLANEVLLGVPTITTDTNHAMPDNHDKETPAGVLLGGHATRAECHSALPHAAATKDSTSQDLLGGPPVPADSGNALPGAPAKEGPAGDLLGGPPVPADIGHALPGRVNRPARTQPDSAPLQSLASSSNEPDVSQLRLDPGPTTETAKAALHLPHSHAHPHTQPAATAGERAHVDLVNADSQVPMQQSLAEVDQVQIPPIGPGPKLPDIHVPKLSDIHVPKLSDIHVPKLSDMRSRL